MHYSNKKKILIVVSQYNQEHTDSILQQVKTVFDKNNYEYTCYQVPGALEITAALYWGYNTKKFSGFLAIGCIIKGESYHFELVAQETMKGITKFTLDTLEPTINALMAVYSTEQAFDRSSVNGSKNIAISSANALISMMSIKEKTINEENF